jgi:hypothetical protein
MYISELRCSVDDSFQPFFSPTSIFGIWTWWIVGMFCMWCLVGLDGGSGCGPTFPEVWKSVWTCNVCTSSCMETDNVIVYSHYNLFLSHPFQVIVDNHHTVLRCITCTNEFLNRPRVNQPMHPEGSVDVGLLGSNTVWTSGYQRFRGTYCLQLQPWWWR